MTSNTSEMDAYNRGYRAALERVYATLRTDPRAVTADQAYRHAVGAEAVQADAGEQSRNQRLEQRLVAMTKDVVRLTRNVKAAAAAAKSHLSDLDAANAEIARLQQVIADLEAEQVIADMKARP